MSALEETLLQKFRNMDEYNQLRLLEFAERLETPKKSWDEWLKLANALHDELVAQYGENHYFNSVDVLNEIREERLDDIMGRG
jgi:DNA-binding GntR family transcriptional regulator